MICDDVRRRILENDHDATPPPEVAAHLVDCAECRAFARRVVGVDSLLMRSEAADPELVDAVMAGVAQAEEPSSQQHGALGGWFFGGLLLTGAMVAVRHSLPFQYLAETVLGARVDLAVTTSIGLVLVAYLSAFVLTTGRNLKRR